MISYLAANTGSSIEELKDLPFHEFQDYRAAIIKQKQEEYDALVGEE